MMVCWIWPKYQLPRSIFGKPGVAALCVLVLGSPNLSQRPPTRSTTMTLSLP